MVQKKWTIFPKCKKSQVNENHAKKRVKTSLPEKPTPFRILQSFNKTGEVFSWRLSHCLPLCHLRERRHHPEVQVFSMKSFPEDWFASRNKFQVFLLDFPSSVRFGCFENSGLNSFFRFTFWSPMSWHVQYSGRPLCRVQRLVTWWYVGFVSYNTFFITLQCTR